MGYIFAASGIVIIGMVIGLVAAVNLWYHAIVSFVNLFDGGDLDSTEH